MKKTILLIFTIVASLNAFTQNPGIIWEKTYGGTRVDIANKIINTNDGGYLIVGSSSSTDQDISQYNGNSDVWVVKLNADGTMQWEKTFGGADADIATSVQQTTDGGYIIAAQTYSSNTGDVGENHGQSDYWIIKINGTGTMEWQKLYGGSDFDVPNDLKITSDDGYIIAGNSYSSDGDVTDHHNPGANESTSDFWVIKINNNGTLVWAKSYGSDDMDFAFSIVSDGNNNFVVVGKASAGSDVTGNHGGYDLWTIKIDNSGSLLWGKSYGGYNDDWANCVINTSDGGFVIAGGTESEDGDVTGFHGDYYSASDEWILKIDENGTIQWGKALGGTDIDEANSIFQTSDGDYMVCGISKSNDGDASGNQGDKDFWVIKLNPNGNITWQNMFGGTKADVANSVIQTQDGNYITVGSSLSSDGDVSTHYGYEYFDDFWVVKFKDLNSSSEYLKVSDKINVYPNPATTNFTITFKNNRKKDYVLQIINTEGKTVFSKKYTQNTVKINRNKLASGIYTIQIKTSNKTYTKKLLLK